MQAQQASKRATEEAKEAIITQTKPASAGRMHGNLLLDHAWIAK